MQENERQIIEMMARMDEGQKFIIKNIEHLREEIEKDKAAADNSRRRLHERIEGSNRDMRELEQTVITIGQIATQQQENIRALTTQIKPVMERWDDMRKAGKFLSWVLVLVGVSGTTLFFTAKEWFIDKIVWLARGGS